ncbi:centrosomal protein [Anaeramoeba ignava]|uniref:Centrosomal protein n=1 Tax=Anaeramoeba ignava TaxID=1746090 RepID=A0A9Q0REF1_ANAIG|nr:centrosomal protein [Anaeramoeba ignava]
MSSSQDELANEMINLNSQLEFQTREISDKILETKKEIKEKKGKIKLIQEEKQKREKKINEEKEKIQNKIKNQQKNIKKVSKQLQELKQENKTLKEKNNSLNIQIKNIHELKQQNQKNKSKLKKNINEKLKEEIDSNQKKNEEKKIQIDSLEKQIEIKKNEKNQLQKEFQILKEKNDSNSNLLFDKLKSILDSINNLVHEIQILTTKNFEYNLISKQIDIFQLQKLVLLEEKFDEKKYLDQEIENYKDKRKELVDSLQMKKQFKEIFEEKNEQISVLRNQFKELILESLKK